MTPLLAALALLACSPAPNDGDALDADGGLDSGPDPGQDTGDAPPTWTNPIVAGATMDLDVAGPELTDAVLAGDRLLFAGQEQSGDGGIWVFDLDDPDAPTLRGRTSTWHIQRLCADGDVAFGMTRQGQLLRVALDEAGPVIEATWPVSDLGEGVDCADGQVAASFGEGGAALYDAPDASGLNERARIEGEVRDVLFDGDLLWTLARDRLTAWQLGGDSPVPLGELELPGTCGDLAAGDDWLAVACGAAGVALVDAADGQPTLLGQWRGHASARAVDVDGDHVLVAGWTELLLLDAADPTAPWLRATEPARSAAMAVAAAPDGVAYVADWNQPFPVRWTKTDAPELRALVDTVLPGDSVTLTNDGPVPLWVGDADTDTLDGATIEPGQTLAWTIPDDTTGKVSLHSNDPDEPVLQVELSDGTGISVGAEAPEFIERDLEATTWTLSALRGEVVFLGLFTDG